MRVRVHVGEALPRARVGHASVGAGADAGAHLTRAPCHLGAARRVEGVGGGVLAVLIADHPVRPVEQQHPVLGGHTHDVGEGQQRQLGRDVLGEVGPAQVGHLVDEPLRPGGDGVLQRSHGARRERACEQAPEPCVLRRVLIEHHPLHEGEHVGGARVAYLGAAEVRRERAGVAQHPVHQLVGEHRPEAGTRLPAHQLGFGHPVNRRFAPQPDDQVVRHPVHIRARVEQRRRVEADLATRGCAHRPQPAIRRWGGLGGLASTKKIMPRPVMAASSTNAAT